MNKNKLNDALEKLSMQLHRSPEEQFFIRMLRQVWQIDASVPPSDVWRNIIARNQAYFGEFMDLDDGDEKEEAWLLNMMDEKVEAFIRNNSDPAWRTKIITMIDELNHLRARM
jgi:hypothetical protein